MASIDGSRIQSLDPSAMSSDEDEEVWLRFVPKTKSHLHQLVPINCY